MPIRRFLLFIVIAVAAAVKAYPATDSGVRITGSAISAIADADTTGGNSVWDFSECEVFGRASLRYIGSGDSSVMELLPELRSDFCVRGDSMWLRVLEGRTWRCVTDSLRITPQTSGLCTGMLSVHLSRQFRLQGRIRQNVSSGHTLIVSPGDTITGVRLLTLSFSGELHESADTLFSESPTNTIEGHHRYWFADASTYPVATDYLLRWTDGGRSVHKAYIFPLAEHPQGGSSATEAPISRAAVMPGVSGRGSADSGKQGFPGDGLLAERPAVSVEGRSVTVNISAATGDAEVLLCDIAGRVLESRRGVSLHTSFSGLRPGEYLISISTDGVRMTEKISIR